MASRAPTLEELAARVAELEARDKRVADLGRTVSVDLVLPTRDEWQVRSVYTGTVAGRHETELDARAEVDRLNDECRRAGIRHMGEPMLYEVHREVDVIDDATFEGEAVNGG